MDLLLPRPVHVQSYNVLCAANAMLTVDADYVVTNTHGSEFDESISMENVSKLSDKTLSATAMTTRPPMADGVYTNKRRGRRA